MSTCNLLCQPNTEKKNKKTQTAGLFLIQFVQILSLCIEVVTMSQSWLYLLFLFCVLRSQWPPKETTSSIFLPRQPFSQPPATFYREGTWCLAVYAIYNRSLEWKKKSQNDSAAPCLFRGSIYFELQIVCRPSVIKPFTLITQTCSKDNTYRSWLDVSWTGFEHL